MPCLAFSKPSLIEQQPTVVPSGCKEVNKTLYAVPVVPQGPVHAQQKPKTLPGRFPDSRDRARALKKWSCAH